MNDLNCLNDLNIMSLLVPFEYEFFRNGFFAAVVVGALCGFIGVYVVLRRMSYIGHGLSHAIFGGAVLSYVMNLNFPRQTQDMLPHHKRPYHRPPHP